MSENQIAQSIEPRFLAILECPRDHSELELRGGRLCCAGGHEYPIVNGIPVFLLAEAEPTIGIAKASLQAAQTGTGAPLYLDTIGVSDELRRKIARDWKADNAIDSVIAHLIGATSGRGYAGLVGNLKRYPIPDIPIADGNGERLLDIGASWGRWSVSAARKNWQVIALDPSLGALMAAQRAFAAAQPNIGYVCGDARYLPFKPGIFRAAFSYSVLQHFAEADAERAIAEIGRTLRSGKFARIQMAAAGGLRSRYIVSRPDYVSSGRFKVRYWRIRDLQAMFDKHIGPAQVVAEAYGGLGLLPEDWTVVSLRAKALIAISAALKKLSRILPTLVDLADSVYVTAIKR